MLNLYAQVDRQQDGIQGMSRTEFEMWLAMLPVEISAKLGPGTFEEIDTDGNGIIDISEMCNWVQTAVKTLLNSPSGSSMLEADGEASKENTGEIVLDVSDARDESSAQTAGKSMREKWKVAFSSATSSTVASASSSRSSNGATGGRAAQSSAPAAVSRARPMVRSKAVDRQESSVTRSPDTLASSVRTLSQVSWQGGDDHSRSDLQRPNTSRRSASVRPCFDESSLRTLFGGSGSAASSTSLASPSGERATSTPPVSRRYDVDSYHPRNPSRP